jgi:hypothetical protein
LAFARKDCFGQYLAEMKGRTLDQAAAINRVICQDCTKKPLYMCAN